VQGSTSQTGRVGLLHWLFPHVSDDFLEYQPTRIHPRPIPSSPRFGGCTTSPLIYPGNLPPPGTPAVQVVKKGYTFFSRRLLGLGWPGYMSFHVIYYVSIVINMPGVLRGVRVTFPRVRRFSHIRLAPRHAFSCNLGRFRSRSRCKGLQAKRGTLACYTGSHTFRTSSFPTNPPESILARIHPRPDSGGAPPPP
jgi:hypothetical protein